MRRSTLALALSVIVAGALGGWALAPRPRPLLSAAGGGVSSAEGLVVRLAALRRRNGAWRVALRNAARVGPGTDVSLAFKSGTARVQPDAWPLAPLGGPRVRAAGPTHTLRVSFSVRPGADNRHLQTSADTRAEGPTGSSSSSQSGPALREHVRLLPIATFGGGRLGSQRLVDEVLLLGIVTANGDPRVPWEVDDWSARLVENLARHPSQDDPLRSKEWSSQGDTLSAIAAALAPPEAGPILARLCTLDPKSVRGGYAYVNTRNLSMPAGVLCGASRKEVGLSGDRMTASAVALESKLEMPPWHWHLGSPDPDARELATVQMARTGLHPAAARDVLAQGETVPADVRAHASAVAASEAEARGLGAPRSLLLTALVLLCLPVLVLRRHHTPRWFRVVDPWLVPLGFLIASVSLEGVRLVDEASFGCAFAAIGVATAVTNAPSCWRAPATLLFVVTSVLFGVEHVTGWTITDAVANATALGAVVCTLRLATDLAPAAAPIDPGAPQRPRRVVLRDLGRLLLVGLLGPTILLPIAAGTLRGGTPPFGVIALAAGLIVLVFALMWWRRQRLEAVFRAPVTARDGTEIPRRFVLIAWLLAAAHVAAITATARASLAREPPSRALMALTVFAGIAAGLLAAFTATRFVLAAFDRRDHETLRRLRATRE